MNSIFWDGSQVCSTLSAHNANGAQRMPDKQHFNCIVETYEDRDSSHWDGRIRGESDRSGSQDYHSGGK